MAWNFIMMPSLGVRSVLEQEENFFFELNSKPGCLLQYYGCY